jgi:hypothetical protein
VLLLLAFAWWNIQVAMVVIFCGFAANSFVKWLYYRVPISRSIAKLRHRVSHNNDNLVPAVEQPSSIAIDEAVVDE